ncbi:hypothetical protein LJR010_000507 [Ensifer adhaerens]|uniref:hypothetical protein n=1 Tax=Ensifer adhaerens TaxID=106592 RepID=UPI00399A6A84
MADLGWLMFICGCGIAAIVAIVYTVEIFKSGQALDYWHVFTALLPEVSDRSPMEKAVIGGALIIGFPLYSIAYSLAKIADK